MENHGCFPERKAAQPVGGFDRERWNLPGRELIIRIECGKMSMKFFRQTVVKFVESGIFG